MTLPKITSAEVRKAEVAIVGGLVEGVNAGFIHGTAATVVTAVVAFLTAVGVYAVPNKAAKSPVTVSGPAVPPSTTV